MTRNALQSLLFTLSLLLFTAPVLAADAPPPKKMKPALLVIDVQNAYLPFMCEQDKRLAPMIINGAIELFRSHSLPVIRVYHTDLQWGPKSDAKEFQFADGIGVRESDAKIVKNYPSAFKSTSLEKLLRDKGINTLFLTGLSATGCVLATYRTADDLDFDVFMIKGGLISPKAAHTEMIEDICNSISYEGLKVVLDNLLK